MNDRDQLLTLRELLRDALEITRTGVAEAKDAATSAGLERARAGLTTILTDLDEVATARSSASRS